jgi:hypothetical protein
MSTRSGIIVVEFRLWRMVAAMKAFFTKQALLLGALAMTGCQFRSPLQQMSYSQLGRVAEQIDQTCTAQVNKLDSPEHNVCALQEISREQYARQIGSDGSLLANVV